MSVVESLVIHMAMLYYTGRNITLSTLSTTAEVNLSHITQESHDISDQSRNFEDNGKSDSSFPIATVIVLVLICVVGAVLLVLGCRFRNKLKDWIHCNSEDHGTNIDLEVKNLDTSVDLSETDQGLNNADTNTSILPLMTQDHSGIFLLENNTE